jgi:hypothetical protein
MTTCLNGTEKDALSKFTVAVLSYYPLQRDQSTNVYGHFHCECVSFNDDCAMLH